MSEHDFKLNVDSLIDRLLEGMCKHETVFIVKFVLLLLFFGFQSEQFNSPLKCC